MKSHIDLRLLGSKDHPCDRDDGRLKSSDFLTRGNFKILNNGLSIFSSHPNNIHFMFPSVVRPDPYANNGGAGKAPLARS